MSDIGARKRSIPLDLERAVEQLKSLKIEPLRKLWDQWFDDDPPACQSAEFIRRLAAWRLQAERFGGLPADAKRCLRRLRSASAGVGSAPAALVLKPGTMISRNWRGKVQRVHVLEDCFAYQGKHYDSLSEIARLITGKRWSGPRFFGVEHKARKAARGSDGIALERTT